MYFLPLIIIAIYLPLLFYYRKKYTIKSEDEKGKDKIVWPIHFKIINGLVIVILIIFSIYNFRVFISLN